MVSVLIGDGALLGELMLALLAEEALLGDSTMLGEEMLTWSMEFVLLGGGIMLVLFLDSSVS